MSMDDTEKDLYIRAIRAHAQTGTVAENHKVPVTLQEKDLMKDTNREATKTVQSIPYATGQYESIFNQRATEDALEKQLLEKAMGHSLGTFEEMTPTGNKTFEGFIHED